MTAVFHLQNAFCKVMLQNEGRYLSAKKIAVSNLVVLILVLCNFLQPQEVAAQATIRYQNTIRGGATLFGNSWVYAPTLANSSNPLVPDVDNDPTTTHSTYSDLILPAGSTIVKAYLALEKGPDLTATEPFISVKIKVPGAGNYQTLSTSGTYSLVNRFATGNYYQSIFDITALIPATGYVSVAGGGAAGRYYVADPMPGSGGVVTMGGWSIIIVYSNPLSKLRSVTVADNWQYFLNSTVNTVISNVLVPANGIVKAVVGATGTYGDRGYNDVINFGVVGGVRTPLVDPTTGVSDDALNSTIGMTAQNNVSADGGPAISGNITTRAPISQYHIYGPAESYEYDADIFDGTGAIPPSATPVDVQLQQSSINGDVLYSGSYFVSVDLATPPKITKTVSPASITDGGIATYTWTIANNATDAVSQIDLGFTDLLPASIKIAAIPNANITGGSGGIVSAVANSNVVSLSGLILGPGETATIKVDITNTPGNLNNSCSSNPTAFTNSAGNVSNYGILDISALTPQCLLVTANTSGTIDCSKTMLLPAPVQGTAALLDLAVTLNVSVAGCFGSLSISGSGLSLATGVTQVCTTVTGIQVLHIPVQYDGSAISNANFTVGQAGSCNINLTSCPSTAPVLLGTTAFLCGSNGTSVNLNNFYNAPLPAGTVLVWKNGGTIVADPGNITLPGSYTAGYFNASLNCSGPVATVVVAIPIVSANSITADQAVCSGSIPATLTGSNAVVTPSTSFTYQWQSSTDGNVWNDIAGATAKDFSPAALLQTTYYRRLVKLTGCSDDASAKVVVTVNPNLAPAFSLPSQYCQNEPAIDLPMLSDNGIKGNWNMQTITTQTPGSTNYLFTPATGECASGPFSITVTIKPLPPAFSLGNDTSYCNSDKNKFLLLQPVINANVNYLWQDGSTSSQYVVDKSGIYSLTISNSCGAVSDSIKILTGDVFCKLYMPNVFTPNGDGQDDVFRVKYPFPVKTFRFAIYNRWGQKVFETNDMNKGWNGKFNGVRQPNGGFAWLIWVTDNSNQQQFYKGMVLLVQ